MDDLALLAQSDLFSTLDQDALRLMLTGARTVRCGRNNQLFSEGDEAEELYVVRSGRVAIAKRSSDGRESVLALMESGDLFGEMPLFDGEHRSADARALENTELLVVPYPPIKSVLEERPELLWEVVALLSRRLRAENAAWADSVFLDVTGRTAKRLLELAGLVGASRERVNKAIAAFVRLGWIEQVDRRYRITDRDQLARRAR